MWPQSCSGCIWSCSEAGGDRPSEERGRRGRLSLDPVFILAAPIYPVSRGGLSLSRSTEAVVALPWGRG